MSKTKKYIIDTDAPPKIPYSGWTVESHKGAGKIEWNPEKFQLYLSDKQRKQKYVKGFDLQKELESQTPMNANVLDFLLEHPELIPENWKRKYVTFFGTVYRNSDDSLYVRYWCWGGGALQSDYGWLVNDWSDQYPALSLASASSLKTLDSEPKNLELPSELTIDGVKYSRHD